MTEAQIREILIANGVRPDANGEFARNVWNAALALVKAASVAGEPVAYKVNWPIENSVGGRRFYSVEDMAIHRANVEWLGGKAVPLFDAPQPVPPPAEPTEEMCKAGEREVASGRMARYQGWADFCGQIYRAMVKAAHVQTQKGDA